MQADGSWYLSADGPCGKQKAKPCHAGGQLQVSLWAIGVGPHRQHALHEPDELVRLSLLKHLQRVMAAREQACPTDSTPQAGTGVLKSWSLWLLNRLQTYGTSNSLNNQDI